MEAVFAVMCERFVCEGVHGCRYCASVMRISVGTNVLHIVEKYGDSLVSLTICSSKNEAKRLEAEWNETFRKDGILQEFTELTVKVRKEGL